MKLPIYLALLLLYSAIIFSLGMIHGKEKFEAYSAWQLYAMGALQMQEKMRVLPDCAKYFPPRQESAEKFMDQFTSEEGYFKKKSKEKL